METKAAPTGDALLDELNGALAKTGEPVSLDRPTELPPSLDKLMEAGPAAAPRVAPVTRAVQADKTHSKAAGGHGYRVVVKGIYYARSTETKGNVTKEYRLPFNLPSLTNAKGDSALGIIVGKLLKPALLKLDPLAITFRTHEIESVAALQGAPEPTSLSYMSLEALVKYVQASLPEFPVDPLEYWDVEHLRQDVTDFKTNQLSDVIVDPGTQAQRSVKGGFGLKKSVDDRIKERFAERKEEHELELMNNA